MARYDLRLPLLLFLAALLAACRSTPEPALSPETIVAQTAARLGELSGFHFVLAVDGPAAYLDPDQTLALRQIEGDFVAPDRARAAVRVALPGLVTEVGIISVGGQQWQTNPLTGAWEAVPPTEGFDTAVLFDETIGLPAILAQDLSELVLADELEVINGVRLHRITAVANPDRLATMSAGLIGSQNEGQPITTDLFIAPDSYELHRILLTEPVAGADSPRQWSIDFSQFDQSVTIEPPE